MGIKELKVSKNTDPKRLAGTLKYNLSKGYECRLFALGQNAICIAVKALALLSTMFKIDYSSKISYFNQKSDAGEVSGIQFDIK